METKNRVDMLKKLAAPNLVLILAGATAFIVGVILLFRGKYLAGGVTAGVGAVLFAGGVALAALLVQAIDRTTRARGKSISNDAYFIQGDWFLSFTEAGVEIVNVGLGHAEDERPCVPYGELQTWTFYSYAKPSSKGKLKYTVKFPTRYLPLAMERVDRTRPSVYIDIEEPGFPDTMEKFRIVQEEKAARLAEKPAKIADYGNISVYDSGVYLTKLWLGEKSRFLPWADVDCVSRGDNELIFDCGYDRVHAHFHAGFWRDLEANFPDKIKNDPPMSEDEG